MLFDRVFCQRSVYCNRLHMLEMVTIFTFCFSPRSFSSSSVWLRSDCSIGNVYQIAVALPPQHWLFAPDSEQTNPNKIPALTFAATPENPRQSASRQEYFYVQTAVPTPSGVRCMCSTVLLLSGHSSLLPSNHKIFRSVGERQVELPKVCRVLVAECSERLKSAPENQSIAHNNRKQAGPEVRPKQANMATMMPPVSKTDLETETQQETYKQPVTRVHCTAP